MNNSESMDKKCQYDVIVAGDICLDIIPEIPDSGIRNFNKIISPGKLLNVNQATISTGGPVSNTGIALHILGLKVVLVAQIGDDDFGKLILKYLKKRKCSSQGINIANRATSSYTIAIVIPGFDRIFFHDSGTNDTFNSKDVNYKLVQQSRIFHLGYPTLMKRLYENDGEEFCTILQQAKQTGVTTSVDMSLPDPNSSYAQADWQKILEKSLPYIDIFLPSIEEAFYFLEKENYLKYKSEFNVSELIDQIQPEVYTRISSKYIEMGARIVGIKCAHRGIYLRTGPEERLNNMGAAKLSNPQKWSNRELWCPAFKAENFGSATGAGDSSIAGFLAALLNNFSIEKSLKLANCLGYQNVRKLDAVSGIQSWEETLNLIENKILKIKQFKINKPGWHWDGEEEIWVGPNSGLT